MSKNAVRKYVFELECRYFFGFIHLIINISFYHYSDIITETEVKSYVDDYVGVLTECLTEKMFICDYHSTYPIDQDLDAMSQVCPEMYP
jgi:hypothetical protein